ncbi:MAG: hypothetical protein QGI21_04295 [Candidatus Poseidoniaceae archaeon]|jgi:hypothetical protein|nr:hypothetical protein [Candidatus Poseidoniaceae archaeon]
MNRTKASLIALIFLTSIVPLNGSADSVESIEIVTDWTDEHAYFISGNVDIGNISATHLRNGSALDVGLIYDTTGENLRIILNTTIQYNDQITINAEGVERSLTVGLWGQPMDDHEVTLESEWEMDQQWVNENGTQKYILVFDGQGWQERVDNKLDSWESGGGSLLIMTSTEDSALSLSLILDSVWKNETTIDGIMTGQVFDARGSGTIETIVGEEGDMTIEGAVTDAWINRSMIDGIVDEKFRLEANGTLELISEDEDESINMSGEIAVLLIETWDYNGTRLLTYQQIEATADLVLETEESRMDISLDTFENIEKWEEGVRVEHLSNLEGSGTFGFNSEDENSSVVINGTVHDFHQKEIDGLVTIDDVHVDGTITGDAQGTFGVMRTIEQSGTQTSWNGTTYDVVIIHQENWFNLTGISALPNSELGVGAHHNESWLYEAPQSSWDNRTIRTVWEQTGPEPSSGDEVHNNSPIEIAPTVPESEAAIGDVTIGREMGYAPIDAKAGDVFLLNHQDGMTLTVTTSDTQVVAMDGHMVDTVSWNGTYGGNVTGTASGNLIIDGPLSGLNVIVHRQFQIPFGDEDELANLTENQSVSRVISPSIISVHDNTPPSIVDISIAEGIVVGEGGTPGHLEVTVSDVDYNANLVTADLSSVDGGIVTLNDRGLDGDRVIGDDIYTTTIVVPGIQIGIQNISATVTDAFDESSTENSTFEVVNQPPRLASIIMEPYILERNQLMIVNAVVYDEHGVESVEMDMRDFGGDMIPFSRVGDLWIGQVEIPSSMTPGDQILKIRMEDSEGSSIIVTRTSFSLQHHVENENDEDIKVKILNSPPGITAGELREIEVDGNPQTYSFNVEIFDHDGLMWAKVKLGTLAPPGNSNKWYTLNNNGDGTWSIDIELRSTHTPSTYEILVKAKDIYGEETGEESIPIKLIEKDATTIVGEGGAANMIVVGAIVGIGILSIIGALIYVRRGSDGEGGLGGFGTA